ncbi:NAD-dependent protein deacylase [Paenibacillus doosanensis]|uniref:NAD-dependent protein deacetylase n=1 Tax=Paenibacillus konkukensis TaxID=2020716 RepID=A0ABY4RTG1_9BACL|nr:MULTISPECIES: NAD-dependent protein deacylase [Paenibacillus]MCS7461048.1 NAD-dependent protein deacylase [Paenibacillus doosanensis]UQZ85722.1 NAD-dependent protein deacetylase [Paenibacillus konkukensis]
MMSMQELRRIAAASGNIVFFGGAGVSTESRIPDFRSAGGLYESGSGSGHSYPPETILSRSFFMEHPELFYEFYKSKMIYPDARPNAAHTALAHMEREGRLRAVVTQNIDGLHQAAGSRCVLELHGSVHRNHCMNCGKFFDLPHIVSCKDAVPACDVCGEIVKPDVVLYEETLDMNVLERAAEAIASAEMLIVGGTSLTVHPAAGLIRYYTGNKLLLINQSPTPYDGRADYLIQDSVGKVLSELSGLS